MVLQIPSSKSLFFFPASHLMRAVVCSHFSPISSACLLASRKGAMEGLLCLSLCSVHEQIRFMDGHVSNLIYMLAGLVLKWFTQAVDAPL
jgi:hypothetical protein